MNKIKSAVKLYSKGPAIKRSILSVILGIGVILSLRSIAESVLIYMGVSMGAAKTLTVICAVASLIIIPVYIARTWRRAYAYNYMLDWESHLKGSNYSKCMRCGCSIKESKRTGHMRVKIGENITTTTYSDGSKDVKKDDVYGNKSYTYSVYTCNGCGIHFDTDVKFADMPHKVNELEALILGTGYSSGKKSVNATIHSSRFISGSLAVFVALAIIAAGFLLNKFGGKDSQVLGMFDDGVPEGINTSAELGDEELSLIAEAKALIGDGEYIFEKCVFRGGNIRNYDHLFTDYWVDEDGNGCYYYRFSGVETSSGLKENCYIMPYNGETCIYYDGDMAIYSPETEFYKAHYEPLMELSGKELMLSLINKVNKGTLYYNEGSLGNVIKSEDYSLFLRDDKKEIAVLDETGETRVLYSIEFTDVDSTPDDIINYRPTDGSGTPVATDELGKLFADADYSSAVAIYENGNELTRIRVENRGKGEYSFEFDQAFGEYIAAEYVVFTADDRYEVKVYNDETNNIDTTEHKISENKEFIDNLLAYVPENYVRAHFSLDTAKETNILGMIKVYNDKERAKDAKLTLFMGKINKFICEVDDTVKVEIAF